MRGHRQGASRQPASSALVDAVSRHFVPPLALVAWFLGLRWGLTAAILVVALWFQADQMLGGDQAFAMPLILNSVARLSIYCAGVWLLVQLRKLLDAETRLARETR
ncbi:hypothetical protein [Propionivibrio sp.]|uniref:hypothetical protein n=1 Tax=Propionivibrio sp. TaxID=2212460 RepID=UPI003BF321EC